MDNPGKLNRRVEFDAPTTIPDGHGGGETGWTAPGDAVKLWANFRFLRGGESVQAARLEGKQPVVITVRNCTQARQIDTSWRMRASRDGTHYNIRSGPVETDDRLYLEITVESGVAV